MKRTDSFHFINKAKKQKLEKATDEDIWGDDPEIDEVDKCIDFATQMCSQTVDPGKSCFPTSYNDFKRNDIYSSTQAFALSAMPSTSKCQQKQPMINYLNSSRSSPTNCAKDSVTNSVSQQDKQQQLVNKVKALEVQNKRLLENSETKHGEIAILRSQLKQANKTIDHEREQKFKILEETQEKWSSKFNVALKDITALKCDVELKNLEVANLKEKISEVKKVYNSHLNMSIFAEEMIVSPVNFTRRKPSPGESSSKATVSQCVQTYRKPLKIRSHNSDNDFFPLKTAFPKAIFEECEQDMSIIVIQQNPEEYQRTLTKGDTEISLVPIILTEFEKRVSLDYLYPDIYALVRLNRVELNSQQCVDSMGKVIFFARELVRNLYVKLKTVDEVMHTRDLEEMDKLYLQQKQEAYPCDSVFSGRSWVPNEAWPETRRSVALLSVIVRDCRTAQQYIGGQLQRLDFTELSNKWRRLEVYRPEAASTSPMEFLDMLSYVTTVIDKTRRSRQFCGFQAAVLKLLSALAEGQSFPKQRYALIFEIFQRIVLSLPPQPVVKYVCEFLKTLSPVPEFTARLCRNSAGQSFRQEESHLFRFTADTCVFQVLSRVLQYSEVRLEATLQIVQFLHNAAAANVICTYQRKEQRCECIAEMYALTTTIVFNALQVYCDQEKDVDEATLKIYHKVFKLGFVCLNVLVNRAPMLAYRRLDLKQQYQIILRRMDARKRKLELSQGDRVALEYAMMTIDKDEGSRSPAVPLHKIVSIRNAFMNE